MVLDFKNSLRFTKVVIKHCVVFSRQQKQSKQYLCFAESGGVGPSTCGNSSFSAYDSLGDAGFGEMLIIKHEPRGGPASKSPAGTSTGKGSPQAIPFWNSRHQQFSVASSWMVSLVRLPKVNAIPVYSTDGRFQSVGTNHRVSEIQPVLDNFIMSAWQTNVIWEEGVSPPPPAHSSIRSGCWQACKVFS